MNQGFTFEDMKLNLSISVGFSVYKDDAVDLHELLEIADMRMYEDKRTKKGRQ